MGLSVSNQEKSKLRVIEKIKREFGPDLCELLNDPTVIEIMLNQDGRLWVERLGEDMEIFGHMAASQAESLIGTVAAFLDTEITADNPILECEFPLDGSRFEALLPPVVSGPIFTIRKKAVMVFTLKDYVDQGVMTEAQREVIESAVREKKNILIFGGTGSGKTTLTNAVISYMTEACPDERQVIIEDTLELQCTAKNTVQLRTVEHVSMARLLKATMRLRPDRILIGEVRDGAALDLLKAWNTGHPGGVATAHANSARDGFMRVEDMVGEATLAPKHRLIAAAVDLIVFIEKRAGGRYIKEILRVLGHDGQDYSTEKVGGDDV
jgi:type IV secretion system protein TrbB